jgi:hypothetical protein
MWIAGTVFIFFMCIMFNFLMGEGEAQHSVFLLIVPPDLALMGVPAVVLPARAH